MWNACFTKEEKSDINNINSYINKLKGEEQSKPNQEERGKNSENQKKWKKKIKMFTDIQKLKVSITGRPVLRTMSREVVQEKEKWYQREIISTERSEEYWNW